MQAELAGEEARIRNPNSVRPWQHVLSPLSGYLVLGPHPHEARYLKLDSSLARARLGWRPLVGLDDTLRSIVDWYRALAEGADMRAVTLEQVEALDRAADV